MRISSRELGVSGHSKTIHWVLTHGPSYACRNTFLSTIPHSEWVLNRPTAIYTNTHAHTHNRFTALFPGPSGWAGARRELLDFMVHGKINALTIVLGATPSGLTSAHLHHPPYFLQAGYPSCRPTNSVKALEAYCYLNDNKTSVSFKTLLCCC